MFGRDDDHRGARIKEQRKLARLTQRQLAERLPYSYSLLNQVECGAKSASPDFVAAVAQALPSTSPNSSKTAWPLSFGQSVRHSARQIGVHPKPSHSWIDIKRSRANLGIDKRGSAQFLAAISLPELDDFHVPALSLPRVL